MTYRGFVASTILVTGTLLCAQKQHLVSTYDPGIRPETPESIQYEQAAESAWFAHLQVLAGDDLKGRRTETPDFIRAVEYVESQFKAIGLKPAGTDGFRQSVGFRTATVDGEHSSFEIVKHSGEVQTLKLGSEVTLSPRFGVTTPVEAQAVFAGYGLVIPGLGVNDLQGLDLRGKIAVIFAGSPSSVHGPLKAYFRTPAARWKGLKAAGVMGLITIPGPQRQLQGGPGRGGVSGAPRPLTQLSDPELDPLRGLQLSATVPNTSANALFAGSAHQFGELSSLAAEGKHLPKFPLAVTIRANTVTQQATSFQAPNVAAILEGSDSKLKKEYVVLSAHLDHLGVGRAVDGDSVYNGAMDNATGIASLIETAKDLAAGPRPKRSILFLAYTGEEEGELGSQFYAHYPTVPRDREPLRGPGPLGVQVELDDRHRRDRRQVMRIEHPQHRRRQLGEVVVDSILDPPGQQGERLDQPLDVRVEAPVRLEQEPPGRHRVLAGELLGELADEDQLALVIGI